LGRARIYESNKICFTLIGVVILFLQFLEYFCIMKYQNKFGNQILNKIRPLGLDAAHGRTTLLGWPCGGLPSWPAPKRSPARHSPALMAVSAHPGKTGEEKSPPTSVARR
jgi:hypothetical protein